jgi:hypothetical protein
MSKKVSSPPTSSLSRSPPLPTHTTTHSKYGCQGQSQPTRVRTVPSDALLAKDYYGGGGGQPQQQQQAYPPQQQQYNQQQGQQQYGQQQQQGVSTRPAPLPRLVD